MNDKQQRYASSATDTELGKQYWVRNPIEQGSYYLRHVMAMTSEDLHSKADIAGELAHRDIEIDNLKRLLVLAAIQIEALICSGTHKTHDDKIAIAIEDAAAEIRNYFKKNF